jgi:hypothetical protein
MLIFALLGPAHNLATAAESGFAEARAASENLRDKKSKKGRKGKKDKQQEKKVETPAPEWSWTGGPFTHFAWLSRQMPDFARFPGKVREIQLSIVAHRKKSLLFLDSCMAKEKRGQWQVSKCNAVALDDKQFLARLVKAGTDTTSSTSSLRDLQAFLKKIRKSAKQDHLLPLLLEASVENKEAYRLLDDVEADIKSCGAKRYFKALGGLPKAKYLGSNVVVIDLGYTVEKGKSSYKIKLSLAKTGKGWRIGGLQLKCF